MSGDLVLEVLLDGQPVQRVALDGREISIGRASTNVVVLDDPKVSGRHAVLRASAAGLELSDLGSFHGTLVGGARIRTHALAPGEEVRIGAYTLRLAFAAARAPAPAPPSPRATPADDLRHVVRSLLDLTAIVGVTDLYAVLETLLARTMALVMGRRGYVVLTREGALSPVVRAIGTAPGDDSFSRTVCERAIERRETVLLTGADADAIGSLRAASPGMVLAVPLLEGGEVLGILYLESDRFLGAALRDGLALLGEVSALGGRALRAALERQQLVGDSERWRFLAREGDEEPDLLRSSASGAMRPVADLIERVAGEDVTCLILGESGTGKEVVARTIHRLSRRRDGPYVAVNCGAIPRELIEGELFGAEKGAFTGAGARRPGRLELAEGGTLVLDEIGELPRDLQVKLLRVLETRTFERLGSGTPVRWNARVLAATNRDLARAVARGDFREDLYYRLNVVTLRLPPLRERADDLPDLLGEILRQTNRTFRRKLYGVAPDALAAMRAYAWPGNIRELRNVVERAMVIERTDTLTLASLPFRDAALHPPPAQPAPAPGAPGPHEDRPIPLLADFMRAQETEFIRLVLDQLGGNVTRAAQALGLTRSALYKKLRALGLQDFRQGPESK